MKFKNETKEDVVIPVLRDNLPSDKLIIKDGETKDVPEQAVEYAEIHGLTPVDDEVDTTEEQIEYGEIEAEKSSISNTKVETKQIKSKKSRKRS